jgi:hypothetical protein
LAYQASSGTDQSPGQRGLDNFDQLPEAEQLLELVKDVRKGHLVLGQALASTWWEWNLGSLLFFWRWNSLEQRRAARDSMRIFVSGTLPENRSSKVSFKEEHLGLIAEKLQKIIDRCYVVDGFIGHPQGSLS